MTPDAANRLPYIDGLRAVAALLVLLTHTWVFTGAPALGVTVAGHTIVLADIPAVGHIGVNLFLVLSGFCLAWPFFCNPLMRERTTALQFWTRRVQRICPAYLASIIFVALMLFAEQALAAGGHWPSVPTTYDATDVITHVFVVHNLSVDHVSTINPSFWSLALEFQLYLLFPLLLEAMRRFGVWRVAGTILILQLAYRFALEFTLSPDALDQLEFVLPKAVFGRWFDFVAGMAAASVVAKFSENAPARGSLWMLLSVVSLATAYTLFCLHFKSEGLLDLFWGVGFSSLVCWAADRRSRAHRILSFKWFTAIGVMSYSLYLVHQPLMEAAGGWILKATHQHSGPAFLIGLGAATCVIPIAALFYLAVEGPALRYFAQRRYRAVQARSSRSRVRPPPRPYWPRLNWQPHPSSTACSKKTPVSSTTTATTSTASPRASATSWKRSPNTPTSFTSTAPPTKNGASTSAPSAPMSRSSADLRRRWAASTAAA